jgi:hypothetical protein
MEEKYACLPFSDSVMVACVDNKFLSEKLNNYVHHLEFLKFCIWLFFSKFLEAHAF